MRRSLAAMSAGLVACYSIGKGISPPLDQVYFPVGLAVSTERERLYVVSSDFDLQYNAGTLLSLDLQRIRQLTPQSCSSDADCPSSQYCDQPSGAADTSEHSYWCVDRDGAFAHKPCGALGERTPSDRVTVPGRCQAVDVGHPQGGGGSLVRDAVVIGAFATNVIVRQYPGSQTNVERLFVPVRGEASLNWLDVTADGKFDCGQDSAAVCDQRHRAGKDPTDNSRALRLPAEPFAVAATADAQAIVMTHQTQGAISLLVNDWTEGPHLQFVYSGLPSMPIAVAAMPQPAIVQQGGYSLAPGFLVSYENAARVDLFRYSSDSVSAPARPYLQLSDSAAVTANASDYDVRGIAVDDAKRASCEAACRVDYTNCQGNCQASYQDCLFTCANVPLAIYASSRSPASLLLAHTGPNTALAPNFDLPVFFDAVPLTAGPSRVAVASIINEMGQTETRVFVVCFDSRRVAIFDPVRRAIDKWVTTGRGPYAMAFDVQPPSNSDYGHALAYVGHFTDSYIGVVDLDRRHPQSYGNIILSIGPATAPRTSK
jgi:hypothetical protein